MKSNSTAQKMEQQTNLHTLQIVTNEEVKTEVTAEVTPAPEAPAEEVKQPQTIDDIKRKNQLLLLLTDKYDRLKYKLHTLESFAISADKERATVNVTDAHGAEFTSNSPKTIGKLVEFWTDEFKTALAELEKEIRENA